MLTQGNCRSQLQKQPAGWREHACSVYLEISLGHHATGMHDTLRNLLTVKLQSHNTTTGVDDCTGQLGLELKTYTQHLKTGKARL